jgi:hypothetical protein
MKPTRRGFLGAIGAIVAVPTSLIGESAPKQPEGSRPIEVTHQNETCEIKFCKMTFFDAAGESLVCENVPCSISKFERTITGITARLEASLGVMGINFGYLGDFGPIYKIVTVLDGGHFGPIDIHSYPSYSRVICSGDTLDVAFDFSIDSC